MENRNQMMIERISALPVHYPYSFTLVGDTHPFASPLADEIFALMLKRMETLDPKPDFMINLGDFAGGGAEHGHHNYFRLVDGLSFPNICVIGNHDTDHRTGWDNYQRIHGAPNFQFSYGNTQFVALCDQGGKTYERPYGLWQEELDYLESALRDSTHPTKIVMMHVPPYLDDHYAVYPDRGFDQGKEDFVKLLKAYKVNAVLCAHLVAFDHYVYAGIPFVVSGGGGWGTYWQVQSESPSRGSFLHFVHVIVQESGAISGHVHRVEVQLSLEVDTSFDF